MSKTPYLDDEWPIDHCYEVKIKDLKYLSDIDVEKLFEECCNNRDYSAYAREVSKERDKRNV